MPIFDIDTDYCFDNITQQAVGERCDVLYLVFVISYKLVRARQ